MDLGPALNQTAIESGIVMPTSGNLFVSYSSIQNSSSLTRFDTFLSGSASLEVDFVSGDSIITDPLTSRFPDRISFIILARDVCDFIPLPEEHTRIDYRNFSNDKSIYRLDLGQVSEGDTVQFFYDTIFLARPFFNVEAAPTSARLKVRQFSEVRRPDGTLAGWNIQFFKFYNICISEVFEELRVFVGLEAHVVDLKED